MPHTYKPPAQSPYGWSLNKSKLGYNVLSQNIGDTPPQGYKFNKVSARVTVLNPYYGKGGIFNNDLLSDDKPEKYITGYGPYIFIDPPSNFGWSDNNPSDGLPATVEIWKPSLQEVNLAMKTYYQKGKWLTKVPVDPVTGAIITGPDWEEQGGVLTDIYSPDMGMAGYVDIELDPTYGWGIYVDFRLHFSGNTNESANNQYGAVDGKACIKLPPFI